MTVEEGRDPWPGVIGCGLVVGATGNSGHEPEEGRDLLGVMVVEEAMVGAGVLLDVVVHAEFRQGGLEPWCAVRDGAVLAAEAADDRARALCISRFARCGVGTPRSSEVRMALKLRPGRTADTCR